MASFSEMIPAPFRSGAGRVILIIGLLAMVGGVWAVSHWASQPVYVTLYRDLEFKEAGQLDEGLKRANIQHRLVAGGTEIQVAASEAAQARVAMAKDGHVVGSRPGMELFDKPSWGMTDFAQRVTYQRAIEGEIARTLEAIRGIDRAQIHLALPAPTPFRSEMREGSASVVLGVTPGMILTTETIQGVVGIVSNSVEGLPAENVAVMDNAGRVLTMPAGDESNLALGNRQLEMQRSIESAMIEKVQHLLGPILGADRVRAEVTAEMSFDKIDRAVESLTPVGTDWSDEELAGNSLSDESVNGRSIERREGAVGKVTRLSAAILVDEVSLGVAAGDSAARSARLDGLSQMVRNALGIDDARGDQLAVLAVPFLLVAPPDSLAGAPPAPGVDIMGLIERIIRPAVGVLALIILLVLAIRVMRLPLGSQALPAGFGGLPSPIEAATNGASTPAVDDPEGRMKVVRGWLNNGKSR